MSIINQYNIKKELFINDYKVYVYDSVSSTNTILKEEAKKRIVSGEEISSKTVVVANSQTNGRGRLGRSFYSPSDTGLYMSCLLPKDKIKENTVTLTAATAVAVCKALENLFGVYPKIKWVNDLYLNQKKICGILAETVTEPKSGKISAVVLGIGINCTTTEFPSELKEAGAICEADGISEKLINFSMLTLAEEILKELDRTLMHKGLLINTADSDIDLNIIEEYKKRSNVLHKDIFVIDNKSKIKQAAYVKDIDKSGGLVVQYKKDGKIEILTTGEITIRFS